MEWEQCVPFSATLIESRKRQLLKTNGAGDVCEGEHKACAIANGKTTMGKVAGNVTADGKNTDISQMHGPMGTQKPNGFFFGGGGLPNRELEAGSHGTVYVLVGHASGRSGVKTQRKNGF